MTTIRHGGPCGLRIEMRSAERDGKAVLFHAPKGHWCDVTGLWGGVWHGFSLRCSTAVFVYLTHSAVVRQFETAILRSKGRMMARTRATPPKQGGHAAPDSWHLWHAAIRVPMGSLSSSFIPAGRLRKTPLSPRASSCRIGPRRQGFASPLRALDGSGPIRRDDCL